MNKKLKKANKIYKKILKTTPYCSGVAFHLISNKTPSKKYGGSCIIQSKILKEELSKAGFKNIRFIRDTLGKAQYALLLEINKELYYANIYLMLPSLINIGELKDTKNKIFESFPHLYKEKSKVKISFKKNKLYVKKTWPKSKRVDEFLYNLNLKDKGPSKKEFRKIIYGPHRKTISIRTLNEKTGKVNHLIYPITKKHKPQNKNFYIKTNKHKKIPFSNKKEFEKGLKSISKQLQISSKELLEFLKESIKLFYINKK